MSCLCGNKSSFRISGIPKVDAAVDAAITDRFGGLWAEARAGGFRSWCDSPRGCLAYIVVTDQFPRNMFRGRPEAFATDALALDCAHRATLVVPKRDPRQNPQPEWRALAHRVRQLAFATRPINRIRQTTQTARRQT